MSAEEEVEPLAGAEPAAEGDELPPDDTADDAPGAERGAAAEVPSIDWRQRALDLERKHEEILDQHRQDMAAMNENFTRQFEALTTTIGAGRGPAQPEVPVDPDVSPGEYFKPIVRRLEAQLAELAARQAQGAQQDRFTRMSDRVNEMLSDDPVFRSNPRVKSLVAQHVLNDLFDPKSKVTVGNAEAEARKRITQYATELKAELAPPKGKTKAEQVRSTMTDKRRAPPTGRGAETPMPGGAPREKPKGNFMDPEVRRRHFLPTVEQIYRSQSAD